jgi:(4S)-4-hydroxy-5-phosphonooxypentane-2,3-dione isomerase
MIVAIINARVKPESIEAFKTASIDNASHSIQEPGIVRFDVLQQSDDPTKFILYEVYRSPEAIAHHKESVHYARWRDAVSDLMFEPRTRIQCANVFPEDLNW